MRKILIMTCTIMFCTMWAKASPPQKIIQVLLPRDIPNIFIYYYDSAFNIVNVNISKNKQQDTLIILPINVSAGQILRYSINLKKEGRPYSITKSFIVPSASDTIKLEVLNDYNLRWYDGGYFIEEIINLVNYSPIPYIPTDNTYLDNDMGLQKINEIFRDNKDSLERRFNLGILEKKEYNILSIIARNDYYLRLLGWAQKNKKYDEIEQGIVQLANEKELIQSVPSSQIGNLFSNYINYIISKDQLDTKNTINIVNAIIDLGWHKGITFEMITSGLENRKNDPAASIKCYSVLKNYLNGEYEDRLAGLARIILPKLTHTDKAILQTLAGKQVSFKQLLANNKGKLFIIDFWASWCKPCRQEAPFFEAAKAKFIGKKIVFVSISLDDDDKKSNWKKALKDDGFLKASNHYKLLKPKNNQLFESFGMPSIPRYVLINDKGEFINPDFPFPSDSEFSKKLLGLNDIK